MRGRKYGTEGKWMKLYLPYPRLVGEDEALKRADFLPFDGVTRIPECPAKV